MTYEKRIDRTHPGCIVFLVDQSGSMGGPMGGGGGRTKADAVAGVINSVLYELVLRCIKDPSEGPRHYYDVGVIGYGPAVGSAFGGELGGRVLVSSIELGNNPLAMVEVPNPGGDGTAKRPQWISAQAAGATPMCKAMDLAGATIADWIADHPDSFPPIVINISDGESTDGDPQPWSDRLRQLATSDGELLMFNVNISQAEGESVFCPSNPELLPNTAATLLFNMSSTLPEYMVGLAQSAGHSVDAGSRGFAFNADFAAVASFLRVGTSTVQVG